MGENAATLADHRGRIGKVGYPAWIGMAGDQDLTGLNLLFRRIVDYPGKAGNNTAATSCTGPLYGVISRTRNMLACLPARPVRDGAPDKQTLGRLRQAGDFLLLLTPQGDQPAEIAARRRSLGDRKQLLQAQQEHIILCFELSRCHERGPHRPKDTAGIAEDPGAFKPQVFPVPHPGLGISECPTGQHPPDRPAFEQVLQRVIGFGTVRFRRVPASRRRDSTKQGLRRLVQRWLLEFQLADPPVPETAQIVFQWLL